jgi:hypothetical protein
VEARYNEIELFFKATGFLGINTAWLIPLPAYIAHDARR